MGCGRKDEGDVVPSDQDVVVPSLSAWRPTHVSHKRVEAYPICAAEFEEDGSGKVGVEHPSGAYIVVPVPPKFLRNPGDVAEGDYLVRYEPTRSDPHGYLSYSPRAVFEGGYTAIERETVLSSVSGLDFGAALRALKTGERVCRAGWNGKSMWLSLSGPPRGLEVVAEKFWSTNNAEFARRSGGTATVLPAITMKTATGEILMGWLASQTDMLAEDWMVLPVEAA